MLAVHNNAKLCNYCKLYPPSVVINKWCFVEPFFLQSFNCNLLVSILNNIQQCQLGY